MASDPSVHPIGSGGAGTQGDLEILFEERRGFTRSFLGYCILLALGGIWGYAISYDPGLNLETAAWILGIVGFAVAVLALFAWAPGTSECKSIRVDHAGLSLGRRLLPAGEVGRCALVPEREAGRAALRWRYQGVRIGWRTMSYNYLPDDGPAVFVVQQRSDLRRPGWLITSADPEGLLAALTDLRGLAGPRP